MSDTDQRDLRRWAIQAASACLVVGSADDLVARAAVLEAYVTGSKDAAVLTAAKEFAEKVRVAG